MTSCKKKGDYTSQTHKNREKNVEQIYNKEIKGGFTTVVEKSTTEMRIG